jgi:hypothetical protein
MTEKDDAHPPGASPPAVGASPAAEAGGGFHASRQRLLNRRTHAGEPIEWRGHLWELRVGVDDRLRVMEVFCTAAPQAGVKVGADRHIEIDDVCVLISRALQHGDGIAGMAESLTREPMLKDDPAASLIGLIVAVAARIEAELQPQPGGENG